MTKFNSIFVGFALFSLLICSCSSDDDANGAGEEMTENQIATKAKLVGEWKLVSSILDGDSVSSNELECLKQSTAVFKEDDTYVVNLIKRGSSMSVLCSQTNTQSGTYSVVDLNSVTFFNSTSEIKLIDDLLQITSIISNSSSVEQMQVDIFIRGDSEDLEEENEAEADDIDTVEDTTVDVSSTFDGSAVIAELLGTWKIENNSNDCLKKNTIEFKSETIFEIIQHKENFNRKDLLDYNLSVIYPMPATFSATVNKGNSVVNFDTEADCKFIKTTNLEYVVKDANTILIKSVPQVKIIVVDDTTITLKYEYVDADSNTQTIEFIYKKIVI